MNLDGTRVRDGAGSPEGDEGLGNVVKMRIPPRAIGESPVRRSLRRRTRQKKLLLYKIGVCFMRFERE